MLCCRMMCYLPCRCLVQYDLMGAQLKKKLQKLKSSNDTLKRDVIICCHTFRALFLHLKVFIEL